MEEDRVDETPPFWLQPSSSSSSTALRRRGRTSSPLLILVVAAASLALVYFALPSFHSSKTPQIPNPKPPPQLHSIKKGWNSLNLALVLFAVICGFLSRTGSNAGSGQSLSRNSSMKSTVTPRTPYRSYYHHGGSGGYSVENRSPSFNRTTTMRSSFSYPDLRQESAWSSYDVDRRRFYDDTGIDRRGFVDGKQIYERSGSRRWRDDVEVEDAAAGVVVEDAATGAGATEGEQVKDVEPPPPPPQTRPEPPVLPPPAVESRRKHRRRRSYEAIPRRWMDGDEVPERPPLSTPPPPPPPPPPPLPVVYGRGSSEEKSTNRNEKKRGGSSVSATKEFFQSLGKKKKQRHKSIENFEALLSHPTSSEQHHLTTLSPPPSPPPPPSHSVLQDLFSSKKSRNRNRKTAPHSSPSPPRRTSERQRNPEPLLINEGNRSPHIPIPPPPPPPPFKVPDWKFVVVHRDYVRIKSGEPSRTNSPDITEYEGENEDDQSSALSDGSLTSSPMCSTMPNVKGGGEEATFCPSPDVDTKADKFIARFREGLKLEKMNSLNQRKNVRSNLGPHRD